MQGWMIDDHGAEAKIGVKEGCDLQISAQKFRVEIGCLVGPFQSVDRQIVQLDAHLQESDLYRANLCFASSDALQLNYQTSAQHRAK